MAPVQDCRPPWKRATACWCASFRRVRYRSMRSLASARQRVPRATAPWRSARAEASRSAGSRRSRRRFLPPRSLRSISIVAKLCRSSPTRCRATRPPWSMPTLLPPRCAAPSPGPDFRSRRKCRWSWMAAAASISMRSPPTSGCVRSPPPKGRSYRSRWPAMPCRQRRSPLSRRMTLSMSCWSSLRSSPRGDRRRAPPKCCRGLPTLPQTLQRHDRLASEAIGRHPLKDGAFALGLGLAFGHAQADALAELARIATIHGACWARPAPGRALLLGPLSEAKATATKQAAARLGLVTEAHDPRRRIVACPGAPACASGLIAARTLAAEIARACAAPRRGHRHSRLGLRQGLRPSKDRPAHHRRHRAGLRSRPSRLGAGDAIGLCRTRRSPR